ncbi:MbeD/MobD family mobilization/exclusion protein [Pantoea stewartii]|uniref:MbeD/MobD family mobilization/exclusion protein n=1 Tax=Pantoea stewartii TaxID=66269 RepID=UPI003DA6D6DA
MTRLEKQLQSALEQLQQDYSKRLDEVGERLRPEWRTDHLVLSATGEHLALSKGASRTAGRHVQSLSEQLRRSCREDERRDRGAPGAGALGAASGSPGAGSIATETDVWRAGAVTNRM